MQIGSCPHDDCDDQRMRILPDKKLPLLSRETCPGCGRTIWVYYSRVDPKAYTQEQFEQEFVYDEVTKSVRPRAEMEHAP